MDHNKINMAKLLGCGVPDIPDAALEMMEVYSIRRRLISPGAGYLPVEILLLIHDKLEPVEDEIESKIVKKTDITNVDELRRGSKISVKVNDRTHTGIYIEKGHRAGWHSVSLDDDPNGETFRKVRKADITIA